MMLGDKLRVLRDRTGLNQEGFAKIIGIARGTYAHYEINKRMPSYDILERIADYHHVSLDLLIRDKKEIDINLYCFDLHGLNESEIEEIKRYIEQLKTKANR